MKPKPEDITFHYTKPEMVKDLIAMIPFQIRDSVLDAGSGRNKVWYNFIPGYCVKDKCEIEEGVDFLTLKRQYEWIIGNPPFHIGYKFILKASELSLEGFAFLLNTQGLNSLTPIRISKIQGNGFYLQKIHIVNDKRWFGRYYFVIFQKKPNDFLSYTLQAY